MLFMNLLLSALLVVVTFTVHIVGLVGLSAVLRRRGVHPSNLTTRTAQAGAVLLVVLGLFTLHLIQVWMYAVAYRVIGEFASMEAALYFSASTFTTVGFGDIVLSQDWRLLSAVESLNGFLLIGWSTAFLVGLSGRIRALEGELLGEQE